MDWVNKHLQIEPINTFIDPIFPVENAIITHAHADHAKPGHKNVLATKHTIEIMKIRYGENCANNFQELSFNSPLNINDSLTSALISRDAMSISLKIPSSNKYPDMPVFFESINH